MTKYLDADEKLSNSSLKIDYYDTMLVYLESILKVIQNRTFQIKNAIEFMRFNSGLGFPESLKESYDLQKSGSIKSNFENSEEDIFSDGTLQILSSNLVPQFQVVFSDLFPYSLSTVTFDATDTDIEYFTADVSFKYTIYNLTDMENKLL